ncbi:MAG: PKD domain-containing protein [bacterium]|nr:PKD domain-containing protein [bacterium]
MKNLFAIAAAFALLLVCASCGTVRALQGDYASKAPALLAVSPTQVSSGQGSTQSGVASDAPVVFVAQVRDETGPNTIDDETGQVGDVLYFWDFGGGAEPNTSTAPQPEVVIRDGARSPYTARLVLTDGTTGDFEEFTFQLFVTPLEVAAVTPTTVQAGATATFSTLVRSGVASQWNWDFGGAGSPGGSNIPAPTVSITQTAGTYNARVFVSNAYESIEVPFTITVLPATAAP